jgi:arylsulfatase A-like enzyme
MRLQYPAPLLLGLSLITTTSCRDNDATNEGNRPNILFIAVDDLRPELGCYGNRVVSSPNIDRLASEGVIFRRAYCNVPVSGASRASLMTGTRPTSYRFINFDTWAEKDNPLAITLPQYLKNNGYYTVALSKVFHHMYDSKNSWDEEWRPSGKGSWRNYLQDDNLKIDTLIKRGMPFECADVPDTAYFDGKTTQKALHFLRNSAGKGKPFFLAVGFLKPHLPFNAPQKYWDMYDPKDIGIAKNPDPPANAPRQAIHNWGELRQYYTIPESGPLTDSATSKLRHGYYACVSYTDAQIGMLLDELKNSGLDKNTIVVLWGDHGWNLGEHGLWCKHCNFNTSLNAPLIFKVPGLTKGGKNNSITEFVDIYPTICELTGLPLPDHLEGQSLKGRLKDPEKEEVDYAVSKFFAGVTLIEGEYFYTEFLDKNDSTVATMLYNHRLDPDENVNISYDNDKKELVSNLSGRLREKRGIHFLNRN